MKDRYAIEVKNLSKKYTKKDDSEFWALKDISFSLKKGTALGIIGANGSGKSTLLKILSGILKPTTGKAILSGKTASILDIGTGFHPDLTGKENVFLNGGLLGMSKIEINQVFDKLVEFSELKDFINEPVKSYSSGMYMRLAFSIFAFLNPEILILDEVFSVGDIAFQKKCITKIKELINKGVSIIIVAHNMTEIDAITDRVILLNKGKIIKEGKTNDVTNYYLENILLNDSIKDVKDGFIIQTPKLNKNLINISKIYFKNINNESDKFTRGNSFEFFVKGIINKKEDFNLELVITIKNFLGQILFLDSPAIRQEYSFNSNNENGEIIRKCIFPPYFFSKGVYIIELSFVNNNNMIGSGAEYFFTIQIESEDWENKKGFLDYCPVIRSPLKWQCD